MRRFGFAFATLALLSLLASAALASETRTASHGELKTVDGVRVLRVWGTPRQRGRAHGVLLGRDVMAIVNGFLQGPTAQLYEKKLAPVIPFLFRWPGHIQEEIAGMLAGMEETLDEADLRIEALDRRLRLSDLQAFNTLGDWSALSCSSFSAWGEATEDGRLLTGRNFDYFLPEVALRTQLVLAEEAAGSRKAFLTVSFPGNLGAITFLNESGVFGAVHDVRVIPENPAPGRTPRLVALRRIAEEVGGEGTLEKALAICRDNATLYGNNFHLAVANGPGGKPCAGVIEYDSDRGADEGAVLRLPEPADSPRIWNTNHYRLRAEPTACRRYEALARAFASSAAEGGRLDVEAMKSLITSASVSTTMHVVVADPKNRTLHLALQRRLMVSAAKEPWHALRWDAVFAARSDEEEGF